METEEENSCVICKYVENWEKDSGDNTLCKMQKRGIGNICHISSESRKDGLHEHIENESQIIVHDKCRTKYIKKTITLSTPKKRKANDSSDVTSSSDESEVQEFQFNFDKHCIICAKKIHIGQATSALTTDGKSSVINYLSNTNTLTVAIRDEILTKILCLADESLPKAKYHRKTCSANLRQFSEKYKNQKEQSEKIRRSMEEIFNYLDDNSENQFLLEDFVKILNDKGMYVPNSTTIWSKLKNHYQDDIVIIKKQGAPGRCFLEEKGYEMLRTHREKASNDNYHFDIIDMACKILTDDIKEHTTENINVYPPSDNMFPTIESVPKKLKYFLEKLLLNQYRKKKNSKFYETQLISLAHAIMSTMFPRLILSPLQVGVGVALHRKYGSRELIDMCHAMGFCCSYDEVRTYETSAAMQGQIEVKDKAFIQFVHDNADWNVETLDGKGTFHSLGGCEIITPASFILPKKPLPRQKSIPEMQIIEKSKVTIETYSFAPLEGMKYISTRQPSPDLNLKLSTASKINSYWMLMKFLKPNSTKGWNGYMIDLSRNNFNYKMSVINFLPFIHGPPSDYSTLYTALNQ
ncbi:hypothetical protein TKK_0000186 [Trichogramma kaykai]